MVFALSHRSLWSTLDLQAEQLHSLIDAMKAHDVQASPSSLNEDRTPLVGRHVALLRRPASSAINGFVQVLTRAGGRLAELDANTWLHAAAGRMNESARLLGHLYQWVDCCGLSAAIVSAIDHHAGVPVTDGLALADHPLYLLGDFLAMRDACGGAWDKARLALVGDPAQPLYAAARSMARQLDVVLSATEADFVLDIDQPAARGRLQSVGSGAVANASLAQAAAAYRHQLLNAVVQGLAS